MTDKHETESGQHLCSLEGHAWVSEHQAGLPVYWITRCMLCGTYDAKDMQEQVFKSIPDRKELVEVLDVREVPNADDYPPEYWGELADDIIELIRTKLRASK